MPNGIRVVGRVWVRVVCQVKVRDMVRAGVRFCSITPQFSAFRVIPMATPVCFYIMYRQYDH